MRAAAVTADEVNAYLETMGDFTNAGPVTVERVEPEDVRVRWTYDESMLRPGGLLPSPMSLEEDTPEPTGKGQ